MTTSALALALFLTTAPASDTTRADDEVSDELSALTLMSIGGGFVAMGAAGLPWSIVFGVIVGVVAVALQGALPPESLVPFIAAPLSTLTVSALYLALGTGLMLWGRGELAELRASQRASAPRARPSIDLERERAQRERRMERFREKNEQKDEPMWPESRRKIAGDEEE